MRYGCARTGFVYFISHFFSPRRHCSRLVPSAVWQVQFAFCTLCNCFSFMAFAAMGPLDTWWPQALTNFIACNFTVFLLLLLFFSEVGFILFVNSTIVRVIIIIIIICAYSAFNVFLCCHLTISLLIFILFSLLKIAL